MQKICLLVAVLVLAGVQATPPVSLQFSSGDSTIGIYFVGNETMLHAGDNSAQKPDMEILTGVLGPHKKIVQNSFFHHAFVIRSSNLHFRAKIAVYKNKDESQKYPYSIAFKNLMLEDPPQQMELKHSSSGYVWIGPGQEIVHRTDVNHDFTLKDLDRQPIVTVRLNRPESMRDDF